MDTDIKVSSKLEKEVLERKTLNVIYINVHNGLKQNKEVLITIDIGQHPDLFKGDYSFIDVNIDEGDYAIEEIETENPDEPNPIVISWLIGEMDSFEVQSAIIKIEARTVGLSEIYINHYDYLHKVNGNTEIIKHLCEKCPIEEPSWRLAHSAWRKFNGIWYKKIGNQYKRRINGKWVAKQ